MTEKLEIDIHPDIKKFWEASGYFIRLNFYGDNFEDKVWHISKNKDFISRESIASQEIDGQIKYYYWDCNKFNGKSYTEKEMLRIINLQSFT